MDIGKLKNRLSALLAKTVENGASEAEANAAIEAATAIASKYGVSLDDLNRDDTVKAGIYSAPSNDGKRSLHEVDAMLGTAIANYCDCKIWRNGGDISFCGIESDIELALFIRAQLKAAMEFEYEVYKEYVHEGRITRGVRASFMRGFANRVSARLKEAKATTAHFNRDTGALIERKGGLIKAAMRESEINLGAARRRQATQYHEGAYRTGAQSGAQATIGNATAKRGNSGLLT